MKIRLLPATLLAAMSLSLGAASPLENATTSINQLGLQLLSRLGAVDQNAVLSPYSIQAAFVLAYAGAEGVTREEMRRVLGYPESDADLTNGLPVLQRTLEGLVSQSVQRAAEAEKYGGKSEPLTLSVANRLFGQDGYPFRPGYLDLTRDAFGAPFEPLDFQRSADKARRHINDWVAEKTRNRIQDLIPPDGVNRDTRLALVNAIHFKSPWLEPFVARETKPRPFHVRGGEAVSVPTLRRQASFRYAQRAGYSVAALPFGTPDLQFLVIRPEARDGLAQVAAGLTAAELVELARAGSRELILELPKFKLEPPTVRLGLVLRGMGMRTAFNEPAGTANFDRMAPRRPDDYLYISEAFHKAFVAVDEKGAEAAAATAVIMARATSIPAKPPEPLEFKVDRPFLFAIQHRPTGACLFLGRVTDPR